MHLPQGTIRQPQAVPLSVKIRSKRDGNEGRGPSLHMDALRVHSPPPFPLRPRQAWPTPLPPIVRPAVLWLLGQAGNKVPRIRGTGCLAALPAVWTTTASSESGVGSLAPLVDMPPAYLHSCPQCLVLTSKAQCCLLVVHAIGLCPAARVGRPVPSECHWHSSTQQTLSVAFGGQLRCPRQHRHQKITDKFLHHKNRRNKNPEAHASGVTCCLVLSPVSLLVRFYLCNFSPTCVLCFVYICCHRICVFILYASVK